VNQAPPLEKIGDRMRTVGLAMALTFAIPAFGVWLFIATIQLIVEMKNVAKSHGSQELRDASSCMIVYMIVASTCIGISISGIAAALNEYIIVLQNPPGPLGWQIIVYVSLLLASIPVIAGGIACSICFLASWKKLESIFLAVTEMPIKDKGISACKTMKIAQLFTILTMGLGTYVPVLVAVLWGNQSLSSILIRDLIFALLPICLGAACTGLVSLGLQLRSYFTAGSAMQATDTSIARAVVNAGHPTQMQQPRVQQVLVQPVTPMHVSPYQDIPPQIPVQHQPITKDGFESPTDDVPIIIDDLPPQEPESIPNELACPFCGNVFKDEGLRTGIIHICPQCGNSVRS